jgi:DNA-binding LacI/PurR family transcriptional regulator
LFRLGPSSERIYQELRRQILSRELPSHSRLPTERELCARFDASRNTVRKAVQRLHAEGFVETRSKSGSHVRPVTRNEQRTNIISLMYGGDLQQLTAIQDRILSQAFTLSIYVQSRTHWDPAKEAEFLRQVRDQRHRALLAFCSPIPPMNEELLAEVAAAGTRVVHIEPYRLEAPTQDFLMPDYARAGYAAAAALAAKGFRNLRYVGIDTDGPSFRLQRAGFADALRDLIAPDARFEDHYVVQLHELTDQNLRRLAEALRPPVGVVCGALCRARTVQRAFELVHGRVPEGVRIVAVEQLSEISDAASGMDRLVFPRAEMFERIIDAVTAGEYPGIRELVPPQLVRDAAGKR